MARTSERLMRLHTALVAIDPAIVGVSVGRWEDSATWLVFPPESQKNVAAAIQLFDASPAADAKWESDQAKQASKDAIESTSGALTRAVLSVLTDEVNALRRVAALPERTSTEIFAEVVRKIDADET